VQFQESFGFQLVDLFFSVSMKKLCIFHDLLDSQPMALAMITIKTKCSCIKLSMNKCSCIKLSMNTYHIRE
jgi:hypothetical protein